MTADIAAIRMTRFDLSVPWGFRLQGGKDYMAPMIISRVVQDGLAEKSGLREGDFLIEILSRPTSQMTHGEAQDLIVKSGNELQVKVERTSARIWTPMAKPVAVRPDDGASAPVKYSLAHDHEQSWDHSGSKSGATRKPLGPSSTTTVGPRSDRPDKQKKEVNKDHEEPIYLRSETLKLLKESEKKNECSRNTEANGVVKRQDKSDHEGRSNNVPLCSRCGRFIQGVFCKASGKQLHPECFGCTTCGSNLKNKGYFVIGGKFYCDIHAKQQGQDHFKATPPIDPNLFYSRAPPLPISPLKVEPIRASYQPDILKRGELFHAPKATSLSPSSRGVPTYSPKAKGYFRVPEAHELELVGYPTQREASPTHLLAPMNSLALKHSQGTGTNTSGTNSDTYKEVNVPNSGSVSITEPRRCKAAIQQRHQGAKIPYCKRCSREIRGPFVVALNDCWCPEHFVCTIGSCRQNLLDVGFTDVDGTSNKICCENCYAIFLAPKCRLCSNPIIKECLNALQQQWHPSCFKCGICQQIIGKNLFFVENGVVFCEKDWNQMFTVKCANCQFPIESGDRFVEALNNAYHATCFSCSVCKKSLEGQCFYGKGNKPYCEHHV